MINPEGQAELIRGFNSSGTFPRQGSLVEHRAQGPWSTEKAEELSTCNQCGPPQGAEARFASDSPLEGHGFELSVKIRPEENCGFPGPRNRRNSTPSRGEIVSKKGPAVDSEPGS